MIGIFWYSNEDLKLEDDCWLFFYSHVLLTSRILKKMHRLPVLKLEGKIMNKYLIAWPDFGALQDILRLYLRRILTILGAITTESRLSRIGVFSQISNRDLLSRWFLASPLDYIVSK